MRVDNITLIKSTYNGVRTVFEDFSLDLNAKTSVVFGRPGSGKTTLLEALAGVEKPSGGSITGSCATYFLSQVPERGFVGTSCLKEIGFEKICSSALSVIGRVGLDKSIMHMSPWKLSRSEKKRLAIARLLKAAEPEEKAFLILDDPFTDMDRSGCRMIIEKIVNNDKFNTVISSASLRDLAILDENGVDYRIFRIRAGNLEK